MLEMHGAKSGTVCMYSVCCIYKNMKKDRMKTLKLFFLRNVVKRWIHFLCFWLVQ